MFFSSSIRISITSAEVPAQADHHEAPLLLRHARARPEPRLQPREHRALRAHGRGRAQGPRPGKSARARLQ